MKKVLLFAAALGAVLISGCGPFSCGDQAKKDGKGAEKAESKDAKKSEAKDAKAQH